MFSIYSKIILKITDIPDSGLLYYIAENNPGLGGIFNIVKTGFKGLMTINGKFINKVTSKFSINHSSQIFLVNYNNTKCLLTSNICATFLADSSSNLCR